MTGNEISGQASVGNAHQAHQAAAVIRTQRLSYERLRGMPVERYLIPGARGGYPHGAAQAVLLSLDSVESLDPAARPLVEGRTRRL